MLTRLSNKWIELRITSAQSAIANLKTRKDAQKFKIRNRKLVKEHQAVWNNKWNPNAKYQKNKNLKLFQKQKDPISKRRRWPQLYQLPRESQDNHGFSKTIHRAKTTIPKLKTILAVRPISLRLWNILKQVPKNLSCPEITIQHPTMQALSLGRREIKLIQNQLARNRSKINPQAKTIWKS